MNTMIFAVYDAFISMGANEEKARKAAEAISSEALATKSDIFKLDIKVEKLDGKIEKLTWMVGGLIVLAMANFARQYFK